MKTGLKRSLIASLSTVTFLGLLLLEIGNLSQSRTADGAVKGSPATFNKSTHGDGVELSKLNVGFIPNRGQYGDSVHFGASISGQDFQFSASGVQIDGRGISDSRSTLHEHVSFAKLDSSDEPLRLSFYGSTPNGSIEGEDPKIGKFNYFSGDDPEKWRTGIPTFGKIRYTEVYPGIDLVFYGKSDKVQYDFIVSPFADAKKIKVSLSGAENETIDDSGNLVVRQFDKSIEFSKPVIYQYETDGTRSIIDGAFLVDENGFRFNIGDYDRSKALIIDPVLSFSTFLGGTSEDIGYSVAVDDQGYSYVTGSTRSANFPGALSGYPLHGSTDVFVTKITPDGSEIVYSTVFGGEDIDVGNDIKVNHAGEAFIVGKASHGFPQFKPLDYFSTSFRSDRGTGAWQHSRGINNELNFILPDRTNPLIALAGTYSGVYRTTDGGISWQPTSSGANINRTPITSVATTPANPSLIIAAGYYQGAAVYKSIDAGSSWSQITFPFDGSTANSVAVDPQDQQKIYLSTGNYLYVSSNGGVDWVISQTATAPSAYIYNVAVDPQATNRVFVSTSKGISRSLDGGNTWAGASGDITFRIIFDPSNSMVMYSGELGGVRKSVDGGNTWTVLNDRMPLSAVFGLVLDPTNSSNLFIAKWSLGISKSTDGGLTWTAFGSGLPTQNVLSIGMAADGGNLLAGTGGYGTARGFAAKLAASGDKFVYSTLVGDINNAAAIDGDDRLYIGGAASDNLIPTVNPLSGYAGGLDGFIQMLGADGQNIVFSTYLGGNDNDLVNDIDVDPSGNIYVTGFTASSNFPLLNARQPSRDGQNDAFAVKIAPGGTNFLYSTYLGGTSSDEGKGIASDSNGNAYVVGTTSSGDFPVGVATQIQPFGGGQDAFAAKIDPSGASLIYSNFIGGADLDEAEDVVVDSSGQAFVSGQSKSIDFPTTRSLKSKRPFIKSANGGATWRNDLDGFNVQRVFTIAFDPSDSATVFIGTDKGIFKSVDHGETWTNSGNGISVAQVAKIVFAPSNPSILYAGTIVPGGVGASLYESVDGGAHWTSVNKGIPTNFQLIGALAVDPVDPNIVYAGTVRLYKTVNGGASWIAIGPSSLLDISDLKIDPTNSSVVYATLNNSSGAIRRSTDGGKNWQVINQGVSSQTVRSVTIDLQTPSRLFVDTQSGIYRSDNGGNSWQSILSQGVSSFAIDQLAPANLYAGSPLGIYESHNQGLTWTLENSERLYKSTGIVSVDPGNSSVLFAGQFVDNEQDAFVTKINSAGTALKYSTLFGSAGSTTSNPNDWAYDLALAPSGSVFVTGFTQNATFPTTAGAFSTQSAGYWDSYLVRLDESWVVRGTVNSNERTPLPDVTMQIVGTDTNNLLTGGDGYYKFGQVRAGGNYVLTPQKSGYTFDPQNMSVSSLDNDLTANFTAISASPVTLTGRVMTPDGLGLRNATVFLTDSLGIRRPVISNSFGLYSFANIKAGEDYTVSVSSKRYRFSSRTIRINDNVSDLIFNGIE